MLYCCTSLLLLSLSLYFNNIKNYYIESRSVLVLIDGGQGTEINTVSEQVSVEQKGSRLRFDLANIREQITEYSQSPVFRLSCEKDKGPHVCFLHAIWELCWYLFLK